MVTVVVIEFSGMRCQPLRRALATRRIMVSRHIPERLKKKIYQEANMTCPNCGERDVSTFEIHHIQPFVDVKNTKNAI